jgi:hypothetical protein
MPGERRITKSLDRSVRNGVVDTGALDLRVNFIADPDHLISDPQRFNRYAYVEMVSPF